MDFDNCKLFHRENNSHILESLLSLCHSTIKSRLIFPKCKTRLQNTSFLYLKRNRNWNVYNRIKFRQPAINKLRVIQNNEKTLNRLIISENLFCLNYSKLKKKTNAFWQRVHTLINITNKFSFFFSCFGGYSYYYWKRGVLFWHKNWSRLIIVCRIIL